MKTFSIFSNEWLDALRRKRVGEIVNVHYEQIKGATTYTSAPAIPADNTIPQITEGTLIFDVNYQPKKIGNKIIIESMVIGVENTNFSNIFCIALFEDNAVDAIASSFAGEIDSGNGIDGGKAILVTEDDITSLNPVNYKVRAGMDNTGTWSFNTFRSSSLNFNFGDTMTSYIKISEIEQ